MSGLSAIVIGKELPQLSDFEVCLLRINCHVKCYSYDVVNAMSRLHQLAGELDIVIMVIQHGDEFWTLDAANAIRESYSFPILFVIDTINSEAIVEEIKGSKFICFMNYQLRGRILLALEDVYQHLLPENKYVIDQNQQRYYFLKESVVYVVYNKLEKIKFDHIRYLVKTESGVELYTSTEKHELQISQSFMAQQIQKPYFVYCHEKILINVRLVDSFTKDLLVIGGQKIPMQEPYKEQVLNMFRIFDRYNI